MNTLSLVPLYRSSIGFDRFNDLFESALAGDTVSYPPYNVIKKSDDEYRIEIAAAGMTESDLDLQVEKDVLTIASAKRETSDDTQYLHRGIAQRAFKLTFRLADYIEVRDASLKNGMLSLELVRNVPEAVKPRRIAVNGATVTPISKAA
jgi:molecular chaperone IbpA